MAIWGYIRVSTDKQNTQNQKMAILEYANKHSLTIKNWIEIKASTRRTPSERRIDELLENLKTGDTLIVAELSRIGRSVGQIAIIVDQLIKAKIKVLFLKEDLNLSGTQTIQKKVVMTLFSLFAEIERDLISERTKEGLNRARAEGKLLGRPKGPGKSKLDGKEAEIKKYLALKVGKASIAKIFGVSWPCIDNFIKKRKL
jgi:DNA invertase Pin-like site-specific DNA recombinase